MDFEIQSIDQLVPDVLVLYSLNVEADGGNGCDNLTKFQLVQDRCLPCVVQSCRMSICLQIVQNPRKERKLQEFLHILKRLLSKKL